MKKALHMSAKELLETFGVGKKGQRRVTSDMVRWLLTDPSDIQLQVAAALKKPVELGAPIGGMTIVEHTSPPIGPLNSAGFNLQLRPPTTFKFDL